MPQPTAIIDLGTNTFQLLVATPGNISEPMQIICQLQRPVQLGLGASNTQQFVDEVHDQLGIKIQVISGIEEADLIYHGIYHSLPQPWNPISLVMDIGGGSVEFILFEGTKIRFKVSLELGGLRLLSLFQQDGQFCISRLDEMQAYILDQMKLLPN